MRWPLVSRARLEYAEKEVEFFRKLFIKEQERADRAIDELQIRVGFAPVSEPVRKEENTAIESIKQSLIQMNDELDADTAEVSLTLPES
jgi:hypothetical protein